MWLQAGALPSLCLASSARKWVWRVLAVDPGQQEGASLGSAGCPHAAPASRSGQPGAVRGSHAAALLAWLGEGAAESRLHVRTHSCRVEPVPSAAPPPQITGLASPPPPAQLWLCHPSPDMPRFALQSVLGTARTSSERRGFGLPLSVALVRALGDRGPGSFSAPSLPVASVLGHLRLPRIYSLG